MKISQLLKEKKTFSFEVFPPKENQSLEPLAHTLSKLYAHSPDFISVTYGAGGTNEGRSVEVCKLILDAGQCFMPHFTCVGNTFSKVDKYTKDYIDMGIENILLLRGDLPKGWTHTKGDFSHASDLIAHFKSQDFGDIDIGAAAYPEVHIEAQSRAFDIDCLRLKADAGAKFFVTQLCHNVEAYKYFMNDLYKAKLDIPVIVGIMPILSRSGVINMTLSNGCSIPGGLAQIIGRYEEDKEGFKRAGKAWTSKLIDEYIGAGAAGIHLYTLNKYEDIADIISGMERKLI